MAHAVHEMLRQGRDVVESLPQRRDIDLDHPDSIVEVSSKLASLQQRLEISVCGYDHPRLGAPRVVRADGIDLLLLQDAEETALELIGGVADLIEEDGAAAG